MDNANRAILILTRSLSVVLLALAPISAQATWSVVGVDPETQEVGIAGASCIGGIEIIGGLAPGYGAVAAQSAVNTAGRDLAVLRLAQGVRPQEIIAEIASPDFDASYESRQYGIAALGFDSAGYTGPSCWVWAGNLDGGEGAAQGNVLWRAEVVEDAYDSFGADYEDCPTTLADRLMAALEAGAAQGGDQRCTEEQTALSAFIAVAQPNDPGSLPSLQIIIPAQPNDGVTNPVPMLREEYEAWRLEHPPDDSGCDDDDDSADDDTTDDDFAADDDAVDDDDADGATGCGCRPAGSTGSGSALALLVLGCGLLCLRTRANSSRRGIREYLRRAL